MGMADVDLHARLNRDNHPRPKHLATITVHVHIASRRASLRTPHVHELGRGYHLPFAVFEPGQFVRGEQPQVAAHIVNLKSDMVAKPVREERAGNSRVLNLAEVALENPQL